jgi:hypothetical protein
MDLNENLHLLVSELSKQKPDLAIVKNMCQKTGFNYSTDLIQLMSDILIDVARPRFDLNMNQKVKNAKNKPPQDSVRI